MAGAVVATKARLVSCQTLVGKDTLLRMLRRCRENLDEHSAEIAQLGEGVGKCAESRAYLEKSRSIREEEGQVYSEQEDFEKGLKTLEEAEEIRTTASRWGWALVAFNATGFGSNIDTPAGIKRKQVRDSKDVDKALQKYAKAQKTLEAQTGESKEKKKEKRKNDREE
eukprot:Skav223399  [mRNA]  locus=scaffold2634:568550:573746:- [translate_table: standard]